jgi:hypothetical protein
MCDRLRFERRARFPLAALLIVQIALSLAACTVEPGQSGPMYVDGDYPYDASFYSPAVPIGRWSAWHNGWAHRYGFHLSLRHGDRTYGGLAHGHMGTHR